MTRSDNINDYTKNSFISTFITGDSILNYKIVIYWLPIIIYTIVLCLFILLTHSYSEYYMAIISMMIMFSIYFSIDFIYQIRLCKKKNISNHFKNALANSINPSIFVGIGYACAIILPNVKDCNITTIANTNEINKNFQFNDTHITNLINIHRNNIVISIFFYIFSLLYNNKINKKKCINNKLC